MIETSCKKLVLFIVIITPVFINGCDDGKAYQNTSLSFEKRVDDLVAGMTLKEKVSQMQYDSPAIPRLGIPQYNWWNECLHGVGRAGLATVFPQPIGMAAMWDKDGMYDIATVVSDEARAKHNSFKQKNKRGIYNGLTFWTPNINIFRDPRWGRGMETYGEDPYLTSELGVSFINGLQGNDSTYLKLVATAKHFAVHSGPEYNRHSFNAVPSKYDFLETYLPQFKKAVQDAHVYSVMCAYNRLKGQPCCGSKQLSDLLRKQWNFDGYIVSDCWAVRDFYAQNAHEVVNTKAEASAIAVLAGTDLNCGNSYPSLVEAVELGYLTEEDINVSVKRLMLARMKLGMFDPDQMVPFSKIPIDVVDSEKHRLLALQASRKSMVLLKNEEGLLPLNKNLKSLAVIGPNANHMEALLGNYNGYSSHPVTPLQGCKDKLLGVQVNYALGCSHTSELPYMKVVPETVLFVDSTMEKHGLNAAYFSGADNQAKPDLERIDTNIDFTWWDNGPSESINPDEFMAEWTGFLVAPACGEYAIGIEGLNEINLWIDGELLLSHESEHHPIKKYIKLQLKEGHKYALKIQYTQAGSSYATAKLLWEEPKDDLLNEAIEVAQKSEAVILCMGLSPLLEGEEMDVEVDGFSGGDRVSIALPEIQQQLIKKIMKLNKPTVLVLMNGSALAINWEKDHVPAILEAWYPGQSGGTAIADVLFGDYNPSGKLPITFYKSVEQLPDFEDYNMEGRTYRYFKGEPLYPFGYGLSYSDFKYSNLTVPEVITAGESMNFMIDVENKSPYDGDEVVQVYLSHPNSKFKVPIRSLKAFQRIHLKSGAKKSVTFKLEPEDMAVLNNDMKYILDGQSIDVSVGGCQPTKNEIKANHTVMGKVKIQLINNEVYVLK